MIKYLDGNHEAYKIISKALVDSGFWISHWYPDGTKIDGEIMGPGHTITRKYSRDFPIQEDIVSIVDPIAVAFGAVSYGKTCILRRGINAVFVGLRVAEQES